MKMFFRCGGAVGGSGMYHIAHMSKMVTRSTTSEDDQRHGGYLLGQETLRR